MITEEMKRANKNGCWNCANQVSGFCEKILDYVLYESEVFGESECNLDYWEHE